MKRKEKIADYIAKGGYDIIGISCTSALEGITTQRVAEAAKRASENVTVVVGGYQATSEALGFMKKIPSIDIIVLSDFEPIAKQLYAAFDGKIPMGKVPNVIYRENSRIYISERKCIKVEPEDLPIYDFSLVEKYIPTYVMFTIEASRGCPYNCSFCQEKTVRQSYTVKGATVAADEIIDAVNYIAQFVEHIIIDYSDPLWGANPKWVRDFCSQLINRKDEITANTFGWTIGARVGQFNEETFSLMKKAGCVTIAYGVESLSPTMLKIMNKTRNPHKYITSVFDTVKKH
jgi:radical SAM superfamily enzyme YgiQ (UPF0313 family)